ncbi:MAG: hypothetical protein KDC39_09775 [Actinobacteria bacterium]|nr:hypothetical protein [Actinomycetota bacterium]
MINCSSQELQFDTDIWTIDHGELWLEDNVGGSSGSLVAFTGKGLVEVESDGFLTGAEGTGYLGTPQNPNDTQITLNFDDPYAGGNSFSCSAQNPALACTVSTSGNDNAIAVYIVKDSGS